jgi:hypothetical protein
LPAGFDLAAGFFAVARGAALEGAFAVDLRAFVLEGLRAGFESSDSLSLYPSATASANS